MFLSFVSLLACFLICFFVCLFVCLSLVEALACECRCVFATVMSLVGSRDGLFEAPRQSIAHGRRSGIPSPGVSNSTSSGGDKNSTNRRA